MVHKNLQRMKTEKKKKSSKKERFWVLSESSEKTLSFSSVFALFFFSRDRRGFLHVLLRLHLAKYVVNGVRRRCFTLVSQSRQLAEKTIWRPCQFRNAPVTCQLRQCSKSETNETSLGRSSFTLGGVSYDDCSQFDTIVSNLHCYVYSLCTVWFHCALTRDNGRCHFPRAGDVARIVLQGARLVFRQKIGLKATARHTLRITTRYPV